MLSDTIYYPLLRTVCFIHGAGAHSDAPKGQAKMKSNYYSRYFPANQENAAGFPAFFEKKKRENLPLPFTPYTNL
jgi:hypothetical protein